MFLLLSTVVTASLGADIQTEMRAPQRKKPQGLFASAFAPAFPLRPNLNGCYPEISKFDLTDPNLSQTARKSLLTGVLFANDKSKGSTWLVQLGQRRSLRYDLPYNGGNHESAVSPDGKHFVIPHYETPTYNSTEGGGDPGYQASIIDVQTGRSDVLPMQPSPWVDSFSGVPLKNVTKPKPHGATFHPNGNVLITGQVDNSIWMVNGVTGNVTIFDLAPTGCSTPHLVRLVPSATKGEEPTFAVTGCRGSNADTPADYVGHLAIIDLTTGEVNAYETPGGKWNEGITVTAEGEIWVGSLKEHFVTIFGWADGVDRTIHNLQTLDKLELRYPLRFAYEEVTDRVAVATLNQPGVAAGDTSDSGFHVYDAKTHKLIKSMTLKTERGVINSEGLRNGPGFFFTGGYDTQALVVVDAFSLEQVAEIFIPRCTLPAGLCGAPKTYMPNTAEFTETHNGMTASDIAKSKGYTGWNNWSGGICKATLRSPYDRRFATLDGFNYSPVFPAWAWL